MIFLFWKETLEHYQVKAISAYKHNGFWQCMDTKRDKEVLEEFSKKEKIPPWHKKIP